MNPYYDHAGITIYHADCREVLPSLPPVDLVLTDPPYNCGKDYGEYKDNLQDAEYFEFMKCITGLTTDICRCQGWVAPRYKMKMFLDILPSAHIVVVRRGAAGPFRGGFSDQFETVLCVGKPFGAPSDLWDGIRLKAEGYFFTEEDYGHPGYTPIKIFERLINIYQAKTICDPFCGTGTSLVAAKQLGRRAIGIEIEEKYCEIAARRLSQEIFDFSDDQKPDVSQVLMLEGFEK